jgi:hypothetical protein
MITANDFLDKGNFNNTTDMLDEFAKIKSIAFGVWLNVNCTSQLSKDGWYIYKGDWKTTDECYDIFIESFPPKF